MTFTFIHSIQSELLKTKRSVALWLTVIGGFFIPAIRLYYSLTHHNPDPKKVIGEIWVKHFMLNWQYMAYLLLPMGVILASSLITQIEYRNNTWKQLHTTPQPLTIIFFTKIIVILILLLQFFVFFNIGVLLSGFILGIVYNDLPFLNQEIPILLFFVLNIKLFIGCLPVIGLQYLLSLYFKNYLVPIGTGLLFFIGSLIGARWEYAFLLCYNYCGVIFDSISMRTSPVAVKFNVYLYSICFFLIFTFISYMLYLTKKEKG